MLSAMYFLWLKWLGNFSNWQSSFSWLQECRTWLRPTAARATSAFNRQVPVWRYGHLWFLSDAAQLTSLSSESLVRRPITGQRRYLITLAWPLSYESGYWVYSNVLHHLGSNRSDYKAPEFSQAPFYGHRRADHQSDQHHYGCPRVESQSYITSFGQGKAKRSHQLKVHVSMIWLYPLESLSTSGSRYFTVNGIVCASRCRGERPQWRSCDDGSCWCSLAG